MLTKEQLMNEAGLGLNEEQAAAIAALSANDEQTTFNSKFSEIHNGFDAIVKDVTGMEKEGSEKTSDYVRRALGKLKSDGEGFKTERDNLTSENTTLKEQIANGSGADKTLINNLRADVANLTSQLGALKTEKEQAEANHAKELRDIRITSEIESALGNISIKKGLSDQAVSVLKRQAVETVKGTMNPDIVKGSDGVERLVFRDENGAELRNADNNYMPFTAGELLTKELTKFGVVDGRGNGGAGGQGGNPPATGNILNGVRTQMQAMDAIENHLSAKGIARTDSKWQEEFDRIWTEEKVGEMPLQ